jgi:hypothetical protein
MVHIIISLITGRPYVSYFSFKPDEVLGTVFFYKARGGKRQIKRYNEKNGVKRLATAMK